MRMERLSWQVAENRREDKMNDVNTTTDAPPTAAPEAQPAPEKNISGLVRQAIRALPPGPFGAKEIVEATGLSAKKAGDRLSGLRTAGEIVRLPGEGRALYQMAPGDGTGKMPGPRPRKISPAPKTGTWRPARARRAPAPGRVGISRSLTGTGTTERARARRAPAPRPDASAAEAEKLEPGFGSLPEFDARIARIAPGTGPEPGTVFTAQLRLEIERTQHRLELLLSLRDL
jgi:hypothetical protein